MFRRSRTVRSVKWSFPEVESLEERTLLGPISIVGTPHPVVVLPSPVNPYVRKNQSTLTSTERDNFINAIKTLKTTYRPGSTLSIYDEFVQEHYDAFSAGQAHGGPAFLAWHREFLLQFEHELQTVNPTVTIPYWDFTVDNSTSSSIWDKAFMGGDGDPNDNYVVKTGPFRQGQWTLAFDGPDLRRDFGGLVSTLPTADDVAAAFDATYYDVYPFDTGSPIDQSFRNNIEGFNHPSGEAELHNRVHN
jgi:tyrosinase